MTTVERAIDWSKCELVESVPGRLSGTPVLRNTRLQAQAIVDNYEDGLEPTEIAETFEIELLDVLAILRFAGMQRAYPA